MQTLFFVSITAWTANCMKFHRKCASVVRFSHVWNPTSQSISCSFLQMLFPRCRNYTISHIALLPWNPISSVVPTLQKLHDFTYCVAALKPYQFSCSHAAEIGRFHILRCCLEQQGLYISHISYGISYNLLSIQCGGHLREANFRWEV